MNKLLRFSVPALFSVLAFGAFAPLAFAVPPLFDAIVDQVVNEDASAQSLPITNISPESATITAASSNTALIPDPVISGSGAIRTLTYTPAADQNGSVTITVTADDASEIFARTFTITVNPVNDTPSFTKGADQSISENSGAQTVVSWATSISKGASNESSQTLDFIVTNDNNALFSSQPAISPSGTLTYTSATNVTGATIVTVSLHDNGGGDDTSATQTFTITVSEDTTPPSMSISSPAADGSFTNDDTPSFIFSAGDAAIIECKMDDGSFSACTSPYTASILSEGSHTFTASSSDLAGNGATVSRQLTVDKTAPTNQDTVFASSVAKQGGASVSIISSGDATNNVWFAPTGTTNFVAGATMTKAADGIATTILAPADAGNYKLFVIDAAGNISTGSTATLTVDNTSPTAAITYSDSDSIVKSGDTLTITATFSEVLADSPVVKIAITGSNSVLAADMTKTDSTHYYYTHTVGAGDGAATVALSIGTDIAGNVITGTPTGGSTFTVDNTAPSVPTTPDLNATSDSGSSNSDNITNSTTPTFTFTAESGSSVKIYDTDGTTIIGTGDPTTGTYVVAVSTLSAGAHSITAKATDAAGNESSASSALSVTIDTSAPVISALTLSPSSGYAIIGDAITLTITADAPGYLPDTITVNGVAVTNFIDNTDNTYTATYIVVSGDTDRTSGTTPASVVLSDVAGNTNAAFTSVSANTLKVDAHVPTLDSARTTSTTTIDLTFSEDLLGTTVTNADFSVSGYTLDSGNGAFEVTAGVVRLTVTTPFGTADTPTVSYTGMVKDAAGNAAPVAGPITPTDGIAPTLSSVTIASNNASTTLAKVGNTVTVSFTASEALGGTPVVTIRGNAASVSGSGPYTATYTMQSGDAEGMVPFTINFTDSAGNTGVQITSVTSGSTVNFDKTAPVITLLGLSPIDVEYASTYSDAGATASDNLDGNLTGSIVTANLVNTAVIGSYSVTYNVSDSAGNAATEVTRTVTVIKAPSVTTITCSPSSVVYAGIPRTPCTVVITGAGGLNVTNQSLFFINYSDNTDVGTATAEYTYAGDSNHLGSDDIQDFDITEAPLTVTADDQTKVYGTLDPVLTYTHSALEGSDTSAVFSGELARAAVESVGTTTITQGTLSAGGNYNITYIPAVFTITVDPNATSVSLVTTTNPDTTVSGTIPSAVALATSTPIGNVTVDIPTGITITGPAGWDGTLNLPSAITTDVNPTPDPANSGNTAAAIGSIEIGFGTTELSFDKGVRILLTGQAGKQVGYSHGAGTFTKITNVCSGDNQTVGDALPAGGDCKIDVDTDLVVWTKHFSTFTTYTTTLNAPVISPSGAVSHGAVNVTMNMISGTDIHYTLDQSTPTCSSALYTGETLTFSTFTVLNALRCDPAGVSLNSTVSSANFSQAGGDNLNSSGGGGGGGGSIAATPATPATPAVPSVTAAVPATPAQGQVLGTETFNFTKALSMGVRGDEVTELQKVLINEGLLKIDAPTGYFGSLTRAAVMAFQKARGIEQAGVVGPLTRTELNKGSVVSAIAKTNLSASQANSIISLLESFGADASVIVKVKASLGL